MLERRLGIVLLVATALLAVANLAVGQYWVAGGSAAVTVYLIWYSRSTGRRRRASEEARAAWTPSRVRTATAGADGHVEAVRALRQAAPALSLLDADRLVKQARGT